VYPAFLLMYFVLLLLFFGDPCFNSPDFAAMPVQRLKVAILSLDLLVAHSGEILTTGKSHEKKPDTDFL